MWSSPRGWSTRTMCASAATSATSRSWARFIADERHSPEATEAIDRRAGGRRARRGAALRHRRQRRDLLRPRRHRAQPGLDHGDGHGQPRHGDRQHRPPGRRREPAARPEQRAGLLRHGLVPARVPRLPPRLGRRDARDASRALWGVDAAARAGPAHPQHARRGGRGQLQGPLHPGRGHRPVRSRHAARHRRPARRWNASSSRTSS